MSQMKTLFISIARWFQFRNFIMTDTLKILASKKDLKLVIFTRPFYFDKFPRIGKSNFIMEDMAKFDLNKLETIFQMLEKIIFFNRNPTETTQMVEMILKKRDYPKYLVLKLVKKVLGKNKGLIDILEKIDTVFSKSKYDGFRYLFEKHHPSLVVSTDFLCPTDLGMIKAAKHHKVPVMSIISNWDHLSKDRLPRCDGVIVWNDFQKNQLIRYYGYDPKDIFISGIPHTDYFVKDREKFLPKREFLKRIDAPPDKKLITYTTATPASVPTEPEIVEILCKALAEGKIKHPSHLHVRLHPADHIERYDKAKRFSGIVTFEYAARREEDERGHPTGYLCEGDLLHYANLVSCSDIIMNIASTVTLDAAICDVPIVNIAFDGYQQKEFIESNVRYHYSAHYVHIKESGGVRIAKNADEMVKLINMYLDNPALDRDGRKRIVKEQYYEADGKAGERVAGYILNFLKSTGEN